MSALLAMECPTGKATYADRRTARRAGKDITARTSALTGLARKQFQPARLKPYHCRECGSWHLTRS